MTFLYKIPKTSSSNGKSPQAKQYSMMPNAQISAISPEYSLFLRISGSAYLIVPLIDFKNFPSFKTELSPKSAIFKILPPVNKIFSSFKSQCAMPFM